MAGLPVIQPEAGAIPHKDGQACVSCASLNCDCTRLLPYYEVVEQPDGSSTCVPFIRVVKIRTDGRIECVGDVTKDSTTGYDAVDEANVWPGYPAPPVKAVPVVAKLYCNGSATFTGAGVYTVADLGLASGEVITSISFAALSNNIKGVTIKGGCGPADCSLINLSPGDCLSWSQPEGFTGELFELTILDSPEAEGDDMIEITYITCKEGA